MTNAATSLILVEGMSETVRERLDKIFEQSPVAGDDGNLGRHSRIERHVRQALELAFGNPHRLGEECQAGAVIGERIGGDPCDLAVQGGGGPLLEGDKADTGLETAMHDIDI